MSYKVFADNQVLCSSEAEELALLDPIVNLEANCAGSFTFKMPPDHPFYDSLVFRQTLIDVYLDDELIFEGVPISDSTDFYNVKTVECEGELSFLNDTVLTQAKYTNQTVSSLLAAYLQEHNDKADTFKQFQLGSVTVDGGNSLLRYTNYQTTMQEIGEDLLDNFGGYLRVRHDNGVRYLDYLAASPRTSSQVIQIGKNLMDLVQDTSTLDICTVLIPLGAKLEESSIEGLEERLTVKSVNNNKEYIIGTGSAYFGYVWRTVTWDDVTVASNLLSKAQAYLSDAQWANLVITATAYDLGLAVEDVQKFRVLDTIRVVSAPHGLDRTFMLTALQIDLNHPGNTTITLGSEQTLSLSAQSAALTNEINSQATNIIMSAAENARQILESATGGNIHFVYDQDGVCTEILIMDTNDIQTATKIWRWNINGWGYSGDGGQTYSLAATMNGHIYADFVDVGTLQSGTNNANWWNLDTGEIKIGNNANIAGWTINGYALYKTTTLDGDGYQAGIQATQSPASGTAAFYIKNTTDNIFPFIVRYDGSLTATKATITGNITANSLTLGSGVTIPYSKVSNAPDLTVYVAKDGTIGNTPAEGATGFKVSSAGLLTASNAVIYGTLYSSAGTIGGWKIANSLSRTYELSSGTTYLTQIGGTPAARNTALLVRHYPTGQSSNWENDFYVTWGGKLYANNAEISGLITGSTITSTAEKTYDHSSYSSSDTDAMGQIILSGGYPTVAQINKYDINQDGNVDVFDVAIVASMINNAKDYNIKTTTTISPTNANAPIRIQFGSALNGSTISMKDGSVIGAKYIRTMNYLVLDNAGNNVVGTFGYDGLKIYDSSRRVRVILDSTGLYFYNTSGTVTHSYPA